jgi:hypothetical protein
MSSHEQILIVPKNRDKRRSWYYLRYYWGVQLSQFVDLQRSGAKGIRTPDLLIANETLYQLSYSPQDSVPNLLGGVWGLSNVDLTARMAACESDRNYKAA